MTDGIRWDGSLGPPRDDGGDAWLRPGSVWLAAGPLVLVVVAMCCCCYRRAVPRALDGSAPGRLLRALLAACAPGPAAPPVRRPARPGPPARQPLRLRVPRRAQGTSSTTTGREGATQTDTARTVGAQRERRDEEAGGGGGERRQACLTVCLLACCPGVPRRVHVHVVRGQRTPHAHHHLTEDVRNPPTYTPTHLGQQHTHTHRPAGLPALLRRVVVCGMLACLLACAVG